MKKLVCMCLLASSLTASANDDKLTGTPIGTELGYNYEKGASELNIQYRAFDGDFNTYFATSQRSYTWVGLDLGEPHVITRVGWAARNDGLGPGRLMCGVIQGANSEDFLDAVPILIIRENGKIGEMIYGDTDCSRGFRYVRFVSTGDSRCNIAELEFYGTPGEGDYSNMYQITNLPTVIVNTLEAQEPYDKEHDIVANIIILDGNKIDTEASGTIRERGNASRQFPKKPWRLKFDKKQSPLDAPASAKKWTLINNYGDKSLLRNLLAFEIADRLWMEYVPYGRAVDVVLNGEYKGCYQLCDQIEVNKNRVAITEMKPEDNEGEALTGGYLIEVDGYADQEPAGEWFRSQFGTPVTIKSPDDGGTPEQYAFIKSFFNTMEFMVRTENYDESEGYRRYFDITSFIRYFLVEELTGNTDALCSTYMYKDRNDDQLHVGPVWDFDIAFDNDYRLYPTDNIQGFLSFSGKSSTAGDFRNFARNAIELDPLSVKERETKWAESRRSGLISAESLGAFIDALGEDLNQSQELNFKRWPIMREYVHMNPRVPSSYADELAFLKSYMSKRIAKLDQLLNYDPSFNGVASTLTLFLDLVIKDGVISSRSGEPFTLYSIDGRLISTGSSSPALPSGCYIGTNGKGTAKILIQ